MFLPKVYFGWFWTKHPIIEERKKRAGLVSESVVWRSVV
jgi:hypothetical protein